MMSRLPQHLVQQASLKQCHHLLHHHRRRQHPRPLSLQKSRLPLLKIAKSLKKRSLSLPRSGVNTSSCLRTGMHACAPSICPEALPRCPTICTILMQSRCLQIQTYPLSQLCHQYHRLPIHYNRTTRHWGLQNAPTAKNVAESLERINSRSVLATTLGALMR